MILLDVPLFLGRFHPVLVHLPVGFLLLAALLQLAGCLPRYRALRVAVPLSLLAGAVSAVAAGVAGYLLSQSGDYDPDTLDRHMWLGILTAVLSLAAWLISRQAIPVTVLKKAGALNAVVVVMLLTVAAAGHYGGSLTHGSGYISTDLLFDRPEGKKKITNAADALVYADIVHPILQKKCGSCHNRDKKKGQLSMETLAQLKKGGKHGVVVREGKPLESELIKRVLLDPADEHFMPTDGKPPLTAAETAILQWWIAKQMTGEDKKLAAAAPPDTIQQYIARYLGAPAADSAAGPAAPAVNAPPVTEEILARLTKEGFVIKPVSYQPDLLDVTLPAAAGVSQAGRLQALSAVKDNVFWLNVAGNQVTDEQLPLIGTFSNLQRLRLDKNPVTDKGIRQIVHLPALESLNLCNTGISAACLTDLAGMKNLQKVYVWGTAAAPGKGAAAGRLQVIGGSELHELKAAAP